jgi:predicted amidohydrolase
MKVKFMNDMRVAAVQTCSPVGEITNNIERMRYFTRLASERKVDIICFPELNITGYWTHPDIYDFAEPIPGPITDVIHQIASECQITILAGMVEKGQQGVIYNTQIVVNPNGLSGKYRKVHINADELAYFSYGSDLPVFHHPKVTFGIEICYDTHFPELSTSLALKGCELLFLPHASGNGPGFGEFEWENRNEKRLRWLRYLPARAYDNSVFVVVCNQVGENKFGNTFAGTSMILDPRGQIIAEAKSDDEELIIADFKAKDMLKARKIERQHFFLHYRRPEIYGLLTKGEI